MSNKVSFIIQFKDQFSRVSRKVNESFKKIERNARNTNRALKAQEERWKGLRTQAKRAAAASTIAGIAFGLAVKKLVSSSIEMEDAIADVGRVTNASAGQLNGFENSIESLSEKLGKTKLGMAQMAFEGGKLGVSLPDMEPFIMTVAKMATAFDMVDGEAARSIGSIQAKMGLAREETIKLLDSVNFLADNTSASGAKMINIIERTSGTMKLMEVPPEVVASFAGFADQIEVTGELAASGLNMFFNRMQRVPGMTTKLLNDPLGTVRSQLESIAKMGPEVQNTFIREAFGDESGRFVKKMVSNIALFDKTVNDSLSTGAIGSMDREFQNQMGRSSKIIQKFSVTFKNTMENAGDALKPAIAAIAKAFTPIVNFFGKLFKASPQLVQLITLITGVAIALGLVSAAAVGLAVVAGFISLPFVAITLLISAVALLWTNWKGVVGGAKALWGDFAGFITLTVDKIKSDFESLWPKIKSGFISLVNFAIKAINLILAPLNFVMSKLGAGKIVLPEVKMPEIKTPDIAAPEVKMPDIKAPEITQMLTANQAPSAPMQAANSSFSGELVVSAEKGTKVTRSRSRNRGGSNLGMNMAVAQ